jgi:hypothetical protein
MNERETIIPAGTSIHYEMSAKDYHSDADGPRLSQSLATAACCESMLHTWNMHPLLGAGPGWKYVPSTDDGTIIHSLVLEPDSDTIEEVDPSTILTKEGKVAASPFGTTEGKRIKERALAAGRIPLLTDVLGAFKYKAQALRSRFEDDGLLFDGDSEVVIYWEEPGPFGPVRCRARLDHLAVTAERIKVIDLKTTENAHPDNVQSVCWKKGYDIQRAAYVRAVEMAFPEYVGRVDYEIAFAELDKPYVVNVVTLDAELCRVGELRWERGRDRWCEALRNDHWGGYGRTTVSQPPWAKAKEMTE